MLDSENFESINSYWDKTMEPEDRSLFEARLLIDKTLAEDYKEFLTIVNSIKQDDTANLKSRFKILDLKLDGPLVRRRQPSMKLIFSIAAVLLVFTVAGWFGYQRSLENDFAAYEIAEPGLPVVMGSSRAIDFDKAMSLYQLGEYKKSSVILSQLHADKPNDTLQYFLGINNYYLKRYPEAVRYFSIIPANSAFHVNSLYYTAFSYLKQGLQAQAKPFFEHLSQTGNPYQEASRIILKKIKK